MKDNKDKLQLMEIDGLSVLEEEMVLDHRPYVAYLIRKCLNLLSPNWREKHPIYKKIKRR